MDTLFFLASKLIWALISPDSLIVLLGLAAWIALLVGWQRLARHLLSLCVLLLVMIGFLPVGEWLIAPLENRFAANAALPARVDGIIVLGGILSPSKSDAWGQAELGESAERVTSFVYLSSLFPQAQLVFTGGSRSVFHQEIKEVDSMRNLLNQLGLQERAVVYESGSRNTFENAVASKELVSPIPGSNWVLVTSAFHMPRSVGIFCGQDWPVYPYPVDHYSWKGNLLRVELDFAYNLQVLRLAVREWVGLLTYRFSGRSAQLLPGDQNYCGSPSTPV